ncbi:AraC family transcriptional regulator [Paenibacillus oceani]|uniref:Helix-turn-helix transcriptional regulator n=1 Tax=Paenibacillus oceani TaxID=2772510 RepID=A0A927CAC0_9BACL|nr:AraC family transcriptional regulator [Paenibacillus oceani]MBD2864358.1 helix-turn-helix transcriptional regulator [Paenibacillus oceani]
MSDPLPTQVIYAHYPKYLKPYNGSTFFHHNYMIRLQAEGQCHALIGGEPLSFRPGDLLLLRPGQSSEFSFEPDPDTGKVCSGSYTILCRGAWLESWWNASNRPYKTSILPSDSMLAIFKELVLERRTIRDNWKAASDLLLRTLCIHIDRSLQTIWSEPQSRSYVVQRMKQFIEDEERLSAPDFKVKDVARHVGLSESRASHLFKEAFGFGIMSYFLETRLRIARDRIHYMDSSLDHIAEISGFGSYSYFHRSFRKKYGISPKEYRSSFAGRFSP